MKMNPQAGTDYWSIVVDLCNVFALWYFFGHSNAFDADAYGRVAVGYVAADVITQIYAACVVFGVAIGASRLLTAICAVFFLLPFYPIYTIVPPGHLKEYGIAFAWIVVTRIGLAAARAPRTATYTTLARMSAPTVLPACVSIPIAAAAGLYVAIGAASRHSAILNVDLLDPLAVFGIVYYAIHAVCVPVVSRRWVQQIIENNWGGDEVVDLISTRESARARRRHSRTRHWVP
jgi:hypothetical protein